MRHVLVLVTVLAMALAGLSAAESPLLTMRLRGSIDLAGPAEAQRAIDAAVPTDQRPVLVWPRLRSSLLFSADALAQPEALQEQRGPMIRCATDRPTLGAAFDALATAGGWSWQIVHGRLVVFQATASSAPDATLTRLLDPMTPAAERERLARIALRSAEETGRLAAILDRLDRDPGLVVVLDRLLGSAEASTRSVLYQDIAFAIAADAARVTRLRAWLAGQATIQPWHLRLATLIDDRRWQEPARRLAAGDDRAAWFPAFTYLAWCGDVASIAAARPNQWVRRDLVALIARAGLQATPAGRAAAGVAVLERVRSGDQYVMMVAVQALAVLGDPATAEPLAGWLTDRTGSAADPFASYEIELAALAARAVALAAAPPQRATLLDRWTSSEPLRAWAAFAAAATGQDDAAARLEAALTARLDALRERAAASEPTLGVDALLATAAKLPVPASVADITSACIACHPATGRGEQVRLCRTYSMVSGLARRLTPPVRPGNDGVDDLLRWLRARQVPPEIAETSAAAVARLARALVDLGTPEADAALGRLLVRTADDPLGLPIWGAAAATRSPAVAALMVERLRERGAGRMGGLLMTARHPSIRDALLSEALLADADRSYPAIGLCAGLAPWIAFPGGAAERVRSLLAEPPVERQQMIISVLRQTPADDDALIDRARHDPSPIIRIAAITRLGPTAALSALGPTQLADPDEPAVARAVALADRLAGIATAESDPQVRKTLIKVLRAPIPGMRRDVPAPVADAVRRALEAARAGATDDADREAPAGRATDAF